MLEATTETANPTSCVIRPVQQTSIMHISLTTTIPQSSCGCSDQQQTSVVTVTTTVHISATTITPQSSCSCSDQQQTSASSSSVSNVLIITVPVVVLSGVIIVIMIVVIGILIWRKKNIRSDALPYDKVNPATAEVVNDLYGSVTSCIYLATRL